MNLVEHFLTISFSTMNLFSFMAGMLWSLWNFTTWGGTRKLWMQVLLYTVGVALYYFAKSEGYIK
jgi:predicted membrane metal-binding protein